MRRAERAPEPHLQAAASTPLDAVRFANARRVLGSDRLDAYVDGLLTEAERLTGPEARTATGALARLSELADGADLVGARRLRDAARTLHDATRRGLVPARMRRDVADAATSVRDHLRDAKMEGNGL